jgi:hypothetical protein
MRILLTFLMLLLSCPVLAADYVVVMSSISSVEAMDVDKIRDIFLKKRSFDGASRVVPVNPLGSDPARIEFEMQILSMGRDEINRYWVNNHFQGVSPPTTQASLQSIKRFIETVEGAIGYLPIEMVDANLKIIHEF